jgi:hypothetical protein
MHVAYLALLPVFGFLFFVSAIVSTTSITDHNTKKMGSIGFLNTIIIIIIFLIDLVVHVNRNFDSLIKIF